MRTTSVIRIILWSIVLVILIAFLLGGLNGNLFNGISFSNVVNFENADEYSVGSTSISSDGIDDININWVSGSVNINTYDGNDIKIQENDNLEDDDKLRYRIKDGEITIQFKKPKVIFNIFNKKDIEKNLNILIPNKMITNLKDFNISDISSEIDVSNIVSENINIETVSGSVNVDKVQSTTISIESISGRINTNKSLAEQLSLEIVSGEIQCDGNYKKINGESISGDIILALGSTPKTVDLVSVGGDLNVSIPNESGFTVDFESVSGDLNINQPTIKNDGKITYGDGKAEFDYETISGNVDIEIY